MKITFRREPYATGLASITQGERGWNINVDGKYVGMVAPVLEHRNVIAWYWYALGHNTYSSEQYATPEEAKAAAKAYILEKQKEG